VQFFKTQVFNQDRVDFNRGKIMVGT